MEFALFGLDEEDGYADAGGEEGGEGGEESEICDAGYLNHCVCIGHQY